MPWKLLSNLPFDGWLLLNQLLIYKKKKNKCNEFLINAALLNVYFILHYHSIYFFIKKFIFSNVYISANTIFECIFMFFGWERGHQLREIGWSSKMREAAYRRKDCHASCVRTHVHYLFSCFWQHFCLIVYCFICKNITLSLIKKKMCLSCVHFSPKR